MKVYKYGVRGVPDVLPEAAFKQLRLQNDFWNALVELENEFQERYVQLRSGADESLSHIEDQIKSKELEKQELQATARQVRQRACKNADTSHIKEEIRCVNAQLKALREQRKGLRQEVKDKIKPQAQELEQERKQRAKELRHKYAAQGLYWGNYNEVWAKFKVARSRMFQKRQQGGPARLRFHKFTGEGRLTVQLQNGLDVKDLFACNHGQLQIEPVSRDAWDHPLRSVRKQARKTEGRIRVSSQGAAPIWLPFQVTVHREPKGRIKQAQLVRNKVGHDWRWHLCLTVDENPYLGLQLPENEIGLDLGWRRLEDRVRVAVWRDSHGNTGELALDESYIKTSERLKGLQSVIDKDFEAIKSSFLDWKKKGQLQTWADEQTKFLANWRSPVKLARIVKGMGEDRHSGDEEMFREAWGWLKRYEHINSWLANLRDKMQGRRLEQYRIWAKWISRNFSKVYLEEFDLADMAKRKTAREDLDVESKARYWAKVASPGILRSEIERSCIESGAVVSRVDARYTTVTCPHCASRVSTDARANLVLQCEVCGLGYDQDYGAAQNIIDRGSRIGAQETA